MIDSEPPDREIELRLIRAGIRETPPSGTLQRTLAGLGLGASAIATASSAGALGATKATASITLFGLAKWAGIGAASGFMLTTATYSAQYAASTATRPSSNSVTAPKASAPPAPATSTAVDGPFREESSYALVHPTPVPSQAATPAPPSVETEAPLAAEIAFVDRGREALQRGDTGAALALLASYERSFPDLRLMPEVLYLRMQVHRKRDEAARARALAERLVRDFPRSPHASSARAILQGTVR
jgi:hypothetical protein